MLKSQELSRMQTFLLSCNEAAPVGVAIPNPAPAPVRIPKPAQNLLFVDEDAFAQLRGEPKEGFTF
jgi:hypothetical protein